MRGSTDSFIPPTKPDFYTLTKHQSPPICLSAKEHGIKRFTFKSFFLNMLLLLLLMQWLEYILNSNILLWTLTRTMSRKPILRGLNLKWRSFICQGWAWTLFMSEGRVTDGLEWLIYPTFNHGIKLWVVTQRMRSGIRVVKSLLWRVAGLFLIHRMRSLVIWEGLRVEPLLLHHIMVVWTSE